MDYDAIHKMIILWEKLSGPAPRGFTRLPSILAAIEWELKSIEESAKVDVEAKHKAAAEAAAKAAADAAKAKADADAAKAKIDDDAAKAKAKADADAAAKLEAASKAHAPKK